MANPYYDDPRMIGGGRGMRDRRPDHGVCVFSHKVGGVGIRASMAELDDLRRAFADQVMQTLQHNMNVVIVQDPRQHSCSIEMWMPENVQMPRFQTEQDFRPVPVPRSLKSVMEAETKAKKSEPKLIFFYDRLKKEVTDWIKN
jgi:hypothetical protein